jgi:hypothetical protein
MTNTINATLTELYNYGFESGTKYAERTLSKLIQVAENNMLQQFPDYSAFERRRLIVQFKQGIRDGQYANQANTKLAA